MTVKREAGPDMRERRVNGVSGYLPLVVEILGIPAVTWGMIRLFDSEAILGGAAAGLVPPAMFVTGALMWWRRVLRPARRRAGMERGTGIAPAQ